MVSRERSRSVIKPIIVRSARLFLAQLTLALGPPRGYIFNCSILLSPQFSWSLPWLMYFGKVRSKACFKDGFVWNERTEGSAPEDRADCWWRMGRLKPKFVYCGVGWEGGSWKHQELRYRQRQSRALAFSKRGLTFPAWIWDGKKDVMNCEGGSDRSNFSSITKIIFLSLLIVSCKCCGGLKYKISRKADDRSMVKIWVV